mgnify:CR=1 FL=1
MTVDPGVSAGLSSAATAIGAVVLRYLEKRRDKASPNGRFGLTPNDRQTLMEIASSLVAIRTSIDLLRLDIKPVIEESTLSHNERLREEGRKEERNYGRN